MKRAWKIVRKNLVSLSEALKLSWSIAKGNKVNSKFSNEFLRESKWNGKVYGRREYNSCNIYLNNKKLNVSNEGTD